jgi:hypothetical protein
MGAHSRLRQHQLMGDFLVRKTLRRQAQHLALGLGQHLRASGVSFGQELGRNLRGELWLPGGHGLDGAPQLGGIGVLHQVAHRPGAHHGRDCRVLKDAGEHDDGDRQPPLADRRGGLQPAHHWHGQIHQDDVGS